MIASLPMYWRLETAAAWRAMWRDVQAAGAAQGLVLPDLTPPEEIAAPWTDHWLRDDLVLSQTCSMPLRTDLRDKVTYVGTFDFGVTDVPGLYASELYAEDVERDIQSLAINGYDSQSGFVAGLDPLPGAPAETAYAARISRHVVTGSHAASLRSVADGQADACYVDAVTARLCRTFDPWMRDLALRGTTRPTPGLPLITAKGRPAAPLRTVLERVFAARPAWCGASELGGLQGFVVLDAADYLSLPYPEAAQPGAV